MKNLLFLSIALVIFSCGISDKPDTTKMAVTGFPTPLYNGMVSATTGSATITLPPQTVVYVGNFELNVNNKKMMKVFVNDTTEGYVQRDWILEGGKLGVVNATAANPIVIYDDEEGQVISGKTMTDLQLISFKNIFGETSQIIYANDRDASRPFIGYIRVPVTSDSVSMLFCNLYLEANQKMLFENNPAPMEALAHDTRFESVALRSELFEEQQASTNLHAEMSWVDGNGNKLTGADIPGQFALHYIWADKTESDDNHLGDTLEQGAPACNPKGDAIGYKMLFTPGQNLDSLTMICSVPMLLDQEGPRKVDFQNVESGKTYELLIMPNVYIVTCDEATFTVTTSLGHKGEGMVHASCGD